MRVAVVFNKDHKGTINVFGMQNREWYSEETIQMVVEALKWGGHEVELISADRFLLAKLNKFLPKLSKRRPNGIVLNLALGVQGKCRYTHVPAILEVAGIPYTGSSPMGHALAQDKVIAKQIFISTHLPTPEYHVYMSPELDQSFLKYPVIVKPRGEAASFGLKIVNDEASLKEAVEELFAEYKQPALVEEFIEGREVNVSVIGNHPPVALPVLELAMENGPRAIYTYDIKFPKKGDKKVKMICPAKLPRETTEYIQELAVQAFNALNVNDFGRVDFRLDKYNRPHILEMNSMASINPHSSFVTSAKAAGLSYNQLINRIIEAAVERYSREEPDFFKPVNNNNCIS
ncbi:MAG: ATP-grasp domain-containing protein [Acidobacteria bacterium]|nr:ATP-grasp domain-containing protein [Acidobacteriota bacterium]MCG2816028.1 ATP-grasp domain-containing protein [Candidatus Aminicenantes bacterium]MBU1338933.1 ATP-grasp domain-containing protein [Acidobacteriota bacterium]MBU1475404.1 ATP-grasp domain-containing protein [Acidobacteriota bacterium]MBU2438181.1 ATP-grasp domain-containing protein [Acidobacteriota bacterium]